MRSVLVTFFLLIFAATAQAQTRMLDSIAAVVDDDVVMQSELDERVEAIYERIQQSGTDAPPREVLKQQVLERLILERIQLNMGSRVGIRISDNELNQAVQQLAQRQNMTFDQFVSRIAEDGMTLTQLKQQLRDEMVISRVQQAQVNRRIRISEQEVENFLRSEEGRAQSASEVNLGHILLPLSSGAGREQVEEVQTLARDIIRQAREGADYRSLAMAHSAGQDALQGGDLGWRRTNQLPSVFIDPVKDLEVGDVSEPIRSDAGLHLLKLYDRRGEEKQVILQSKVRHILLRPNEIRNDQETRQQLAALADRIEQGEDFDELAREHSEDIGSALSGGELGWSLPGKFVPEFEQTMNNIEIGEVSEPFRSQFGWHMLQVTERRHQDFTDEVRRNQAENMLRQRKFEEELQIWLQEIRDEAYVEIKV